IARRRRPMRASRSSRSGSSRRPNPRSRRHRLRPHRRAPRQRRSADHPDRGARRRRPIGREGAPMFNQMATAMACLVLGVTVMTMAPAAADALKDEIAPTGKLRVAIAISPAGGAFWSTKTESGYAGVPVDLGKAMADQLGVPVEYIVHNNSGQIVDAVSKGTW